MAKGNTEQELAPVVAAGELCTYMLDLWIHEDGLQNPDDSILDPCFLHQKDSVFILLEDILPGQVEPPIKVLAGDKIGYAYLRESLLRKYSE